MDLKRLKEVLETILNDINTRPLTVDLTTNKFNRNQKIYFMNRILDVSGMIHCNKEMTLQLADMLDVWYESDNVSTKNNLEYIYNI